MSLSWLGKSFIGEVEAGGEVPHQSIALASAARPQDMG